MTASDTTPADATERRCENCQAILLGDHCYACGQPTKGMVRHFSSILGDFFDTVLNIDSRVLRTVGPLFLKPGFLTLEYFAGRRVRYVTPVRLFFFLTLIMFFAIHGSIEVGDDGDIDGFNVGAQADDIDKADTVAEVEALQAAARKGFDEARKNIGNAPGADAGLLIAQAAFNEQASERIAYLRKVDAAKTAGKPAPPAPTKKHTSLNFPVNGKTWDPDTNPVNFSWLPQAGNQSLNERLRRARTAIEGGDSEKPIVDAIFRVLPQTLFALMPVFALLLKIAYFFKRRLYMEHLLVALHSHSFIALAITLVAGGAALQNWLVPAPGFFNSALGLCLFGIGVWIPIYLLLMQKRVYGQGWIMTLLKFGALGFVYFLLLTLGVVASLFIGLLTL